MIVTKLGLGDDATGAVDSSSFLSKAANAVASAIEISVGGLPTAIYDAVTGSGDSGGGSSSPGSLPSPDNAPAGVDTLPAGGGSGSSAGITASPQGTDQGSDSEGTAPWGWILGGAVVVIVGGLLIGTLAKKKRSGSR